MNIRPREDGYESDSEEGKATSSDGSRQVVLSHVIQAVEEFKNKLGDNILCEVDVTVDGKWCTFEGTVDSQEVRTALFDLVPCCNGKRFIVDRLHVTYDLSEVSEV